MSFDSPSSINLLSPSSVLLVNYFVEQQEEEGGWVPQSSAGMLGLFVRGVKKLRAGREKQTSRV